MESTSQRDDDAFFANLGEKLFEWRDYTPIPLILIVLFFASPTAASATIGTLIVVAGELLRIYSVAFIGSTSRTRNPENSGGSLITSGPFGMVRNPLYVGNFLITIGFAIYGGEGAVVVLALLMFAFQYFAIVKFEERLLASRYGSEFDDYRRAVPAWIPRRLPGLADVEWPASFSPALRSERRTLLAIVAMLAALSLIAR